MVDAPESSVDIDWHLLDASITRSAVAFLTNALSSAQKPSFLGEVTVDDFSFGDIQPTVQLLDIRDIYKEFLDVDDEEQLLPQSTPPHQDDARGRTYAPGGSAFGKSSSMPDFYPPDPLQAGSTTGSHPNPLRRPIPNSQPSSSFFAPGLHGSYSAHPYPSTNTPPRGEPFDPDYPSPLPSHSGGGGRVPSSSPPTPPTSSSSAPSLQLHLRVTYTGNMQIGLATSLLINYPSPAFMALPLKLLVTSLAFTGTFVVAYEGDRRRVHVSILDPRSEPGAGGEGEQPFAYAAGTRVPRTAGAILLNGAVVESEVGQAEKHVLKNVGKVEKFVLDVARSALESELVFP